MRKSTHLSTRKVKIFLIGSFFCLFLYWLLMSFIFNSRVGFTVLTYEHSVPTFRTTDELLKGDVVAGEFTAKDKNLGLLFVEFKRAETKVEYNQEDSVVFRLKEKGKRDWSYENIYRSGLLNSSPSFPFGFPTIGDSKGKVYVFELQSLQGNSQNAVSLDAAKPFVMSGYQYSKAELLSDSRELLSFFVRRNLNFLTGFKNIEFIVASLIYAFPLILFTLFMMKERIKGDIRVISLSLLLVFIFSYILIVTDINYVIIAELAVVWVGLLLKNKFSSNVSFTLSLFFIVLCVAFIVLKPPVLQAQEKLSLWAFIFAFVGAVTAASELLLKSKHKS